VAAFCVKDPSKSLTFDAILGVGIGGRIHKRAEAEVGPADPTGGRAEPAAVDTQLAVAGPAPTTSGMVWKVPSGRSANGCGL